MRALFITKRAMAAAAATGEAREKATKPAESARSAMRKTTGMSGVGRAALRCFGWARVTSGSMRAS